MLQNGIHLIGVLRQDTTFSLPILGKRDAKADAAASLCFSSSLLAATSPCSKTFSWS